MATIRFILSPEWTNDPRPYTVEEFRMLVKSWRDMGEDVSPDKVSVSPSGLWLNYNGEMIGYRHDERS
jgi:hypothetical protein